MMLINWHMIFKISILYMNTLTTASNIISGKYKPSVSALSVQSKTKEEYDEKIKSLRIPIELSNDIKFNIVNTVVNYQNIDNINIPSFSQFVPENLPNPVDKSDKLHLLKEKYKNIANLILSMQNNKPKQIKEKTFDIKLAIDKDNKLIKNKLIYINNNYENIIKYDLEQVNDKLTHEILNNICNDKKIATNQDDNKIYTIIDFMLRENLNTKDKLNEHNKELDSLHNYLTDPKQNDTGDIATTQKLCTAIKDAKKILNIMSNKHNTISSIKEITSVWNMVCILHLFCKKQNIDAKFSKQEDLTNKTDDNTNYDVKVFKESEDDFLNLVNNCIYYITNNYKQNA